ncbi:MAG: serine/threonine-protein kinase, partial [Acidobacteriota bacterium]
MPKVGPSPDPETLGPTIDQRPGTGAIELPRVGVPDRVGAYRIVEKLGEGGMGSVFLAEQTEPVERQVALKIMRSLFADEESRFRFEVERQAMACLQHPNVAQIFEAGETPDGNPYFVMELVPGESITKYCDQRRLSIKRRLELFRDVCAGVQHAHQKGIMHRDLKPSNILVTEIAERPVVKIIDFGIAKALDRPLAEGPQMTGDRLIGTPAYLSPEAASVGEGGRDVDTRSDVYSLGIVLYELLVGCRPFENKSDSLFQVLQRITAEEPTEPSKRWSQLDIPTRDAMAEQRQIDAKTLRTSLRGDLDWIVLKAIAKDRQERYGSAAELSLDIRRHLKHEPVEARAPSAAYRVGKFVRRRLGTVVAVVLVLLALAAGLVARTLEARRANREAAAAIEARQQTEVALAEAEEARAEAAEVTRFLVNLFTVSDPGEAKGSTVTARELLDAGAENVRVALADQPLTRAEVMQTIADVYRKLGLYDSAEQLFAEVLEIRQRELPPGHLDLAETLNGLAALR